MAVAGPRLFPVEQRAPGQAPGRFGDPLIDDYLAFLAIRVSSNSVLAVWYDLVVFTRLVDKPVDEVTPRDVMGFITAQRTGQDHLPTRPVATGPLKPVSARTIHRLDVDHPHNAEKRLSSHRAMNCSAGASA